MLQAKMLDSSLKRDHFMLCALASLVQVLYFTFNLSSLLIAAIFLQASWEEKK